MKGGKSKSGGKQTHRMLSVRKRKAAKESKRPRAPPTAYGIFLGEFIEKVKDQYTKPRDHVAQIFGAARAKWETMNDADKAPYAEKAEELFAEFSKKVNEYREFMFAKRAAEMAAEELGMNLSGLIIRQ